MLLDEIQSVSTNDIIKMFWEQGCEVEEETKADFGDEYWVAFTPFFSVVSGPFCGVSFMDNKQIVTKDHKGAENGYVLEIQSDWHGFMCTGEVEAGIRQVYMTVCAPGAKKGLHVHEKKEDNFTCVSGDVIVTLYSEQTKTMIHIPMGETVGYRTVKVPPDIAHGIRNVSSEVEAKVINCTYPPYNPHNVDQIEIEVNW